MISYSEIGGHVCSPFFGHVSMIGKVYRQDKTVVLDLQGELPMKMVADGRMVERDQVHR